ncbi:MAG: hypothetical protein SPK87_07235, partial [Bacteroidales bacterium]|nr:hypothetical protein [Bacteroidales bacterium]
AARQLPAAVRNSASPPGDTYAAMATPAEKGIEIATMSLRTTISIEFLPKYAIFRNFAPQRNRNFHYDYPGYQLRQLFGQVPVAGHEERRCL